MTTYTYVSLQPYTLHVRIAPNAKCQQVLVFTLWLIIIIYQARFIRLGFAVLSVLAHVTWHFDAQPDNWTNCLFNVFDTKIQFSNVLSWAWRTFYHHHTTTVFTALFPGPSGWAGARKETSGLYGVREN